MIQTTIMETAPLTDGDIGFLIILAWFLGFGVMLFLLSIFSDS